MNEVILIVIAVAAFGVVHTFLAAYRAKLIAQQVLGRNLAASIYRLVFNFLAVLSLAPALYLVVALPDRELYRFPEPFSYLALMLQAILGLGVVYSVYQLDVWFFRNNPS